MSTSQASTLVNRGGSRGSVVNSSGGSGAPRRKAGSVKAPSVGGGSSGVIKFGFNEDSNGLEVSPHLTLIITLVFIGIVILLHILGKFQRGF